MNQNIVIIGGGICGVVAAINLKKIHPTYQVTIIEKDKEVAKRIKVSGNGRCNFSNANINKEDYKNGDKIEHILNLYKEYQPEFLNYLNLHYFKDEEGRMYPLSNSSKTVHLLLMSKLKDLKINVMLEKEVESIDSNKKIVYLKDQTLSYDKLILSTGGVSYLYNKENQLFMNSLNLKMNTFSPSLCPIVIKEKLPKNIVGKRAKAQITLIKDSKEIYQESGEILFKKDGVSGIVIFNVSAFINRNLLDVSKLKIKINFIENISKVDIDQEETKYGKSFTLKSYVIEEIADYLLTLNKSSYQSLSDLTFSLDHLYPFNESQVSSGGIDLNEINLNNLSLNKNPDIFIGGELLDIDGKCGGFNIFFAFASGIFISNNI